MYGAISLCSNFQSSLRSSEDALEASACPMLERTIPSHFLGDWTAVEQNYANLKWQLHVKISTNVALHRAGLKLMILEVYPQLTMSPQLSCLLGLAKAAISAGICSADHGQNWVNCAKLL